MEGLSFLRKKKDRGSIEFVGMQHTKYRDATRGKIRERNI